MIRPVPSAAKSPSPTTTHFGWGALERLRDVLEHHRPKRVLLVAGPRSYVSSGAERRVEPMLRDLGVVRVGRFGPYPTLDDVTRGAHEMRRSRPEMIVAIGGGAALDLAKAIRTPFSIEGRGDGTRVEVEDAREPIVPLVAVPTTAGTGAEATQFAVMYVDGVKHSLDHPRILPDYALVDPGLTESLSPRGTAVTGMDALSQGIESIWSVASTVRSRSFAARAVRLALDNLEQAVLAPTRAAREAMALAAHLSGCAINLTRTTAAHAASYPLTVHHGIEHGHAVALTLPAMLVFNAQVEVGDVADPKGVAAVRRKMATVLDLLEVSEPEEGARRIRELMRRLSLETSLAALGVRDLDRIVAEGLNPARAGNNPRRLTPEILRGILAGTR